MICENMSERFIELNFLRLPSSQNMIEWPNQYVPFESWHKRNWFYCRQVMIWLLVVSDLAGYEQDNQNVSIYKELCKGIQSAFGIQFPHAWKNFTSCLSKGTISSLKIQWPALGTKNL